MGLTNSCAWSVKLRDLSLLALESSLAMDLFLNIVCDFVNLMCIFPSSGTFVKHRAPIGTGMWLHTSLGETFFYQEQRECWEDFQGIVAVLRLEE